jgi:prepilin-type N-terminal cleavage/methylation domain-containing protein/prepilin-type processing-associated H-X9-DG protein
VNRRQPIVRAFTLIELLVVVAIIALLISILLPALGGAREQGKQTVCLTNMKTMGEAALHYAHDWHDYVVNSERTEYRSHFVAMLLPYIGRPDSVAPLFLPSGAVNPTRLAQECAGMKIINCPKFPNDLQPIDYVVSSFAIPMPFRASDRISDTVGPRPRPASDNRMTFFTKLTRFGRRSPSDFIYVTEAHQEMPIPGHSDFAILTNLFIPDHLPLAGWPRVANDPRHPRGITAMFYDGHAAVQPVLRVDPGAGNTLRDRMRKFTYDDFEPAE